MVDILESLKESKEKQIQWHKSIVAKELHYETVLEIN